MRLGPSAMNFKWGDRREILWTRLCSEMLGGERYAQALTAVLNLDWRNSTSARQIPKANLVAGLDHYIWPLLPTIKPRLVCVLTNPVWNLMATKIKPLEKGPPKCPATLRRPPVHFQIPHCSFATLMVQPDHHPSRALSYAEIEELGRACHWFLAQPTGGDR
jgi:hypothetical protein